MMILVINKFKLINQVRLSPYLTREFDASIKFPIDKDGAGAVYHQYEVPLHQQVDQQADKPSNIHTQQQLHQLLSKVGKQIITNLIELTQQIKELNFDTPLNWREEIK